MRMTDQRISRTTISGLLKTIIQQLNRKGETFAALLCIVECYVLAPTINFQHLARDVYSSVRRVYQHSPVLFGRQFEYVRRASLPYDAIQNDLHRTRNAMDGEIVDEKSGPLVLKKCDL